MLKLLIHILLIIYSTFPGLIFADPSSDEIVANYLIARGGLDKLNAINTVRVTGVVLMQGGHGGHGGGNVEMPMRMEYQLPQQRVRIEYEMQGNTTVNAYDGEKGWTIQPFTGMSNAQEMGAVQLKQTRNQSDFLGVLVNYQEKGHRVELQGTENIEGTDAYKLKITLANGDTEYLYLDKDHYLPFRKLSKINMNGTEVETIINIGDYKEVDGIVFAHSLSVVLKGGAQTITYNNIELDIEVPDKRFIMPVNKNATASG